MHSMIPPDAQRSRPYRQSLGLLLGAHDVMDSLEDFIPAMQCTEAYFMGNGQARDSGDRLVRMCKACLASLLRT